MKENRLPPFSFSVHPTNDAIDQTGHVEIDQQTDLGVTQFQVGNQLGFVDGKDFLDSLQFDNHGILHEQINPVTDIESNFIINHRETYLRQRFHAALSKLVGKAGFISRFQQAGTERAVNLHGGCDDAGSNLSHWILGSVLIGVQNYTINLRSAILFFFPLCLSVPSVVNAQPAILRDQIAPNWLPDKHTFWYCVQTGADTHEFVLIDARAGARKTSSDLASVGLPEPEPQRTSQTALQVRSSQRTGVSSGIRLVNELDLELSLFWIDSGGKRIPYGKVSPKSKREQHTYEGHVWLLTAPDGADFAVVEAGPVTSTWILDGEGRKPEPKKVLSPETSPDQAWNARVATDQIVLKKIADGSDRKLHAPVEAKATFHGRVSWSPDSKAFLVSAAVEVSERIVTIVESTPSDQKQPKVKSFPYAKPGDPLPKPQLVLFRPGSEEGRVIDANLFPTPFTQSHEIRVTWAPDGSEAYFDYNERGHQCYRILAVNAATGAVRVVVEETSKTFIDYTKKTWRHWLHQSGELLWMSERSGWAHLSLHDIASGELKNVVTSGAWPVREVLHVDAEKRQVWFLASGLREGEDPYHLHLCRVNLDGSGFVRLTEGDGNHHVEFSPTREWFIDRWSRADHPPVHELRRSDDGNLVCELERADASALLAGGWTMPERFVAKGRDGKTDIHGILIKPSGFDPAKSYPVIEDIYAGPHAAFAPKDFGRLERLHEMANEGFILVKLDGMGTNFRGKAIHDVAWKNLKDAGFPDRIAWIREAAKPRPWMDLSRVGIYGGSAGGQSAMRAVLDHHEFYQAAVADCGCHDNRMDKIWWNEQWMGWPVDESYAKSSNADDAHKLGGKLLLIVGELDDNVDPASTTQVVAALQKAGKEFEYMPIIGAGHGAAETSCGSKARLEFLKKHLKP
jgi:dipeptidyl-peptidase-4